MDVAYPLSRHLRRFCRNGSETVSRLSQNRRFFAFYRNSFLPAELGWLGFLQDAPERAATTPDELEYYAVRMLALDSPVSFETNMSALQANGRTRRC